MGRGLLRSYPCVIGGIIAVLCTPLLVLAQEKSTVPFIGCPSDGQLGPQEAPEGANPSVSVSAREAQRLAYYSSAQGISVLAPRGWYCFGMYGSGGVELLVSPQPIKPAADSVFPVRGFSGPAIVLSYIAGDTSGRFIVAEMIARVFPSRRAFVTKAMELFDMPTGSIPFGPYPTDTLTYKSETVVEYKTPTDTEGLGTHSLLGKGDGPIYGAAILVGQTPDLLLLSARLPADLAELAPAIVRQVESEADRLSR